MPTRFCGRSDELAHLQVLWQEVATGSGPRVVVLLGDSQVGKTRLVQEFYGWLAREHRSDDGQGYWPLSLTEADRNLLINPPRKEADGAQNPPFMWWGVRVSDPGRRNSTGTGTIWGALSDLDPHLEPLRRAQQHKRYWLDQMRSAAPALIKYIPIVGPGFELAGPVIGLIRREIERQRDGVPRALDEEDRAQRVDLNERIVNKLGLLMRPREDAAPIPLVWVIDDAHFSPSDPGVTELLDRMLREAYVVGWPLLTIVTHWAQPWHEELAGDRPPGIAQRLQALKDDYFLPDLEPVDLGPLAPAALGPMLDERLPGLPPEQRTRLLERTDGLPGFLEELTSFCIEEPHLFVDNDPTQPLEPDGLDEVLRESVDSHKLAARRLRGAPDDVRHMVTLASAQGTRLVHAITQRVVAILAEDGRTDLLDAGDVEALQRAERPYRFVNRIAERLAEFSTRLYHEVAHKQLANVVRPQVFESAFRRAVREEHARGETAFEPHEWDLLLEVTANSLEDSPDESERVAAARALTTLAERARERYEPMLAASHAERILAGADRGAWTSSDLGFDGTLATCAALRDGHRFADAIPMARALTELASNHEERATALAELGDVLQGAGDLEHAGEAWYSALEIRRALADSRPDDTTARDLADAIRRVGHWNHVHGNLDTAGARYEEAHAIFSTLHARAGAPEFGRAVDASLIDMGDLLHTRGELNASLEHYGRALAIVERARGDLDTPDYERRVALILTRIGGALQAQGHLHAAVERYECALEIWERLHQQLGTPNSKGGISDSLMRIGAVLQAQGDLKAALDHHQRALEIHEDLHQRLGTPDSKRGISSSLAAIGTLQHSKGDLNAALEHHQRALEIHEDVHQLLGTPDSERGVAVRLNAVGDVMRARGDLSAALDHYQRAHEIYERLHERLALPGSERDLGSILIDIGDALVDQGHLPAALERYERALEIAEQLRERLSTPNSEQFISTCLRRIGFLQEVRGDLHFALERYQRALEISERVHERLATPNSATDVANAHGGIGDVLRLQGDLPGALERYEQALGIDARVHEQLATTSSASSLAERLHRIGLVLEDQGSLSSALERYEKALEVRRRVLELPDGPKSQRQMVGIITSIAGVLRAQSDLPGALQHLRLALETAERVHEQFETHSSALGVSIVLDAIAACLEQQGDLAGALEAGKRALMTTERAHAHFRVPETGEAVGICLRQVAKLLRLQGDLSGALEMTKQAVELQQYVSERVNAPTSERANAATLVELGGILKAQGNLPGALEHFQHALSLCERVRRDLDTPDSETSMAVVLESIGEVLKEQGDLAGALTRYEDAYAIHVRVHDRIGTPDTELRAVGVLESIGDVHRDQGDLLGALERFQVALEARERVFARLDTPTNERAIGATLARIGRVLRRQGDLIGAQQFGDRALRVCENVRLRLGTPTSELSVSVALANLGQVLLQQGDLPGAHQRYEDALRIAKRADEVLDLPESKAVVSGCLEGVGNVLVMEGDLAEALNRHGEALAIAEHLHAHLATPASARRASIAYQYIGLVLRLQEDAQGAARMHELGRARARSAGDAQLELSQTRLLGEAFELASDDDRAAQAFEDALEIALRMHETGEVLALRARLAAIYRRLDRRADLIPQLLELGTAVAATEDSGSASALLQEASRLAHLGGLTESEVRAELALARIAVGRGEHGRAWSHAMRAREVASASDLSGLEPEADMLLAWVHGLQGEPTEAIARCGMVLERLRLNPHPRVEIEARLLLGLSRAHQGDVEAALEDLRSGLETAERLGDPASMTKAWHVLSNRILHGDARDALAPLAAAIHIAARSDSQAPSGFAASLRALRNELGDSEFDAALHSLHETGDATLSRVAGRDVQVFTHLPEDIGGPIRALLGSQGATPEGSGENPPGHVNESES